MKERIKKLFIFQIYFALRPILFKIAPSIFRKAYWITINFRTGKFS